MKNKEAHYIGNGRFEIEGETYVNEKSSRVLSATEFNALQKQSDGWIRVEDGLPEEGQIVLGYVESENTKGSFFIEDIAYSFFDKGKWAKYDGEDKTVTHWQPLPPAPLNEKV